MGTALPKTLYSLCQKRFVIHKNCNISRGWTSQDFIIEPEHFLDNFVDLHSQITFEKYPQSSIPRPERICGSRLKPQVSTDPFSNQVCRLLEQPEIRYRTSSLN